MYEIERKEKFLYQQDVKKVYTHTQISKQNRQNETEKAESFLSQCARAAFVQAEIPDTLHTMVVAVAEELHCRTNMFNGMNMFAYLFYSEVLFEFFFLVLLLREQCSLNAYA